MTYLQALPVIVALLAGIGFLLKRSPASWSIFPWLSLFVFIFFCIDSFVWIEVFPKLLLLTLVFVSFALLARYRVISICWSFLLIFAQDGLVFLEGLGSRLKIPGFSYFVFRIHDTFSQTSASKTDISNALPARSLSDVMSRAVILPGFLFTTLLAGPILMQSRWRVVKRAFTLRSIFYQRGLALLFLGLVKTQLLQPFWKINFEQGLLLPMLWSWQSLLNFMETGIYQYVNLYLDFSGYTDIVVGLTALLGLKIRHNFKQPYLACSLQDFWRRWHITLADWIRLHIYIPLGGDRKGSRFWVRNILICMLLIGIWHGFAWNYLFWGAMHGIAMIAEGFILRGFSWRTGEVEARPGDLLESGRLLNESRTVWLFRFKKIASWFYTQVFVTASWVVFFW